MHFLSVAFIGAFAALSCALPIDEEERAMISTNTLFQKINDIIKHGFVEETKNQTLEIGDNIKADDGKFQIVIQKYNSSQGFPVFFKPKDEEFLEDKKVVLLSNSSSSDESKDSYEQEFEIIKEKSGEESSEEKSKEKLDKTHSTTEKVETKTNSTTSESSTKAAESSTAKPKSLETVTVDLKKHEKLLHDIEVEPVILTHI